jgi:hypothetical protein
MRTRTKTAITVAALVAGTALFIGTPGAIATQGQALLAGQDNTALHRTMVVNTPYMSLQDCDANDQFGLVGCGNYGVAGEGIYGGVSGHSDQHLGVLGTGSIGVLGDGFERGVLGEASDGGTGVFGHNRGTTGNGVWGQTGGVGSGVYGQATTNGVGVFGDSQSGPGLQGRSASGPALRVLGKATFSRSGIVTVAAGTASKTVSLAGVTTASMVIATAQQNGSVFVKAAVPAGGSFKLWLTGNAPAGGLKVAYFVLN